MLRISLLFALFSATVVLAYTSPYEEAATNFGVQLFGRDGSSYQSNSGSSNGGGDNGGWASDGSNQNSNESGEDEESYGGSGNGSGGPNKDDNENEENNSKESGTGNNSYENEEGNGNVNNGGSNGGNNGDNNGANGASQAEIDSLAGKGLSDRTVDLGTKDLGTTYSRSASSNVVRTRKNNYFRKNFVNKVTSNLRLVRKQVHVSKHITYERPLTVDNIKVHQQTDYVKNIYPVLKKLSIKEYGTVVQPARLVTIQREANSNRRVIRHKEQVSSSSRRVNLGRRVEKTKYLGIRNFSGSGNGNNDNGNGSGNGNGKGKGSGGNGGNGNGGYGYL